MAKKKKKGANQWVGYSEEDRKQADMERGQLKEDNGFYGKHHCKRQKLF